MGWRAGSFASRRLKQLAPLGLACLFGQLELFQQERTRVPQVHWPGPHMPCLRSDAAAQDRRSRPCGNAHIQVLMCLGVRQLGLASAVGSSCSLRLWAKLSRLARHACGLESRKSTSLIASPKALCQPRRLAFSGCHGPAPHRSGNSSITNDVPLALVR